MHRPNIWRCRSKTFLSPIYSIKPFMSQIRRQFVSILSSQSCWPRTHSLNAVCVRQYSPVQTAVPLPVKKPFPRGQCHTAIIGSGPAGFYTAQRILKRLPEAKIDMYESLPVPYGLVRYGVAPDHPEVKNVQHGFEETCQSRNFRFIGNVSVGGDQGVGVDVLKRYYDAVVFAYGASQTRRLGIEGEELPGVYSAGDFVGWYNGLPSHRSRQFNLDGENAVIIGHGNVALDVARILLTPTDSLAKTDITSFALEQLEKSRVKNVYIVGRRGVLQASFTVKELRELTNIANVKFDTSLPEDLPEPKSLPRIQQRIVQLLKKAPFSPEADKLCRIEFLLNPRRFIKSDTSSVAAVEFEKQRLLDPSNSSSNIEGTGEPVNIKADMVFTSIGYVAVALKGMNQLGPGVDVIRGVIPNDAGRVKTVSTKDFGYVDREAAMMERVPGVYVSGWVKTGPAGVIATTMYSAFETGDSLVQDWNQGEEFLEPDAQVKGWDGFKLEIEKIGGNPVEWDGWKGIEAEEERRGKLARKEREKIVDIQEMVKYIKTE